MDLAEKRKQLEAVRAARQAKQQVVEQYMTGRSSNTSGVANTSYASSGAAASPALSALPPPSPTNGAAATAAAAAAAAVSSSSSTRSPAPAKPAPQPAPTDRTAVDTAKPRKASQAAEDAGGPLSPPPPERKKTPRRSTASPAPPNAVAAPRSSAPSSSPGHPHVSPGAPSPLIQVLAVGAAPAASSLPASGAAVSSSRVDSRATPPAATPKTPKRSTTTAAAAATAATEARLHNADAVTDGRGGWNTLQQCMRGAAPARELASETPTHPVCIFNPAVCLGDVVGASDGVARRVVLDATACLVPYEGAAAWKGGAGEGVVDPTTWCVCVAASYGSKNALYAGVGARGDFTTGSAHRRGSVESAAAVGAEAQAGRGAGYCGRSADAALESVRAAMECGYPWGSATGAQTAVPRTTMDAALKVAREAPGLVLAWFVVPLPANALPRKEGTLYAEAATGGTSSPSSPPPLPRATATAASSATAPADYVVVVVPLVCDVEVTTLLAHPFQPSTLLGGTRCGRVVQWAMGQAWAQVEPRRLVERALATTGTATTLLLPPQRPTHSSFPSPQAHQTPVLRMAIHGDASCHHLYSISQEGRVCTWPAWQPLHPTASCLSYLGIRPMGNIGVAARFVERPGTDAMTQVFIATTSGAVLVGANRDAKSIELQYYGPPRPLPTSTTVIKTLDVTASAPSATAGSNGAVAFPTSSLAAGPGEHDAARSQSVGGSGTRHRSTTSPSPQHSQQQQQALLASAASLPHHGRIVSMSLQTAAGGLRGQECVVSAATDGTCAAWFNRTAVPLEGFSAAVTSVCWSPTKPGVLAAGDSSGLVTVWAVNTSIITPVATVSLREAGRRTRGSATSDGVLWVMSGASDAAGMLGGGGGVGSGFFANDEGVEEDDVDVSDDGGAAAASLGQADAVGAAISSVFFSRDGRWLFASTACGYVHALRVSASLA